MKLVESEPIAAGTAGVRLVIPDEPVIPRIAGIVVDAAGKPVAGAEVRLYRRCEDLDLRAGPTVLDHLALTTGADGRFELRDVARTASEIDIVQRWKGHPSSRIDLAEAQDLENLRVVLPSTCHVRIEATESGLELGTVYFKDAQGGKVWVTQREGRWWVSRNGIRLSDRRSAFLQVPTNAVQVSFAGDQGIVLRLPVQLEPGGYHVIRP